LNSGAVVPLTGSAIEFTGLDAGDERTPLAVSEVKLRVEVGCVSHGHTIFRDGDLDTIIEAILL